MENFETNEYHIDLGDITSPIEFTSKYEKGVVKSILDCLKVDFDEDEKILLSFTPTELTNFIININRTYRIGEFK